MLQNSEQRYMFHWLFQMAHNVPHSHKNELVGKALQHVENCTCASLFLYTTVSLPI